MLLLALGFYVNPSRRPLIEARKWRISANAEVDATPCDVGKYTTWINKSVTAVHHLLTEWRYLRPIKRRTIYHCQFLNCSAQWSDRLALRVVCRHDVYSTVTVVTVNRLSRQSDWSFCSTHVLSVRYWRGWQRGSSWRWYLVPGSEHSDRISVYIRQL